jgi:DNA end-binding protein Ku
MSRFRLRVRAQRRQTVAQRPIWRGHLRLALVSCPVALYAARHDRGNLHFHMINPATGHRVRMITQDAETEKPVSRGDLVKGYEFEKDRYLVLTDEDFDNARIESSSTLKIEKFVDASSIDPIYFEASYYVAPDGDAGKDVYVVLRDAIISSGRVALSHVVIAARERAIAIMPMEDGLVAHTLAEERDLNNPKPLFEDLHALKSDPEMIKLAKQLIDRQSGRYDPADAEDRYETRLRAVIAAKLEGEGIAPAEEAPERDNVIDLMAALRQSLGQSADKPAGTKTARGSKAAAAPKTVVGKSARKPARKGA